MRPPLIRTTPAIPKLQPRTGLSRLPRHIQALVRSERAQLTRGGGPAVDRARVRHDLGGLGRDVAGGEGRVARDRVAALAVGDAGDVGAGGVVSGQGQVPGVVASGDVGVRPLAGGVHHDVAGHVEVAGALVEVQAELSGAVAEVPLDHAVGVCREGVDATGVPERRDGVDQMVADDADVGVGGGGVVDRLEVVEAAVDVFGAAPRVVGAPAVSDADAAVGHVGDVVVLDGEPRDVGGQDRVVVEVFERGVVDAVVADQDVAVDHAGVGRVVRVGPDASDGDAAPGALGEDVADHGDVVGAEPDSGDVGVGVVADAQADRTEVHEGVVLEGDVLGRRDLYGGRHLRPAVAARLEAVAAARAGVERVGGAFGLFARYERARLLVRVAVVGVGVQPGGAGERESLEAEVVGRGVVSAADRDQRLRAGQFDLGVRQVLALQRPVVEGSGVLVQVPLAGLVEEFEGAGQ